MDFIVTHKCFACGGEGEVENYRNKVIPCFECDEKGTKVWVPTNYDNIAECALDYPKAISIVET